MPQINMQFDLKTDPDHVSPKQLRYFLEAVYNLMDATLLPGEARMTNDHRFCFLHPTITVEGLPELSRADLVRIREKEGLIKTAIIKVFREDMPDLEMDEDDLDEIDDCNDLETVYRLTDGDMEHFASCLVTYLAEWGIEITLTGAEIQANSEIGEIIELVYQKSEGA